MFIKRLLFSLLFGACYCAALPAKVFILSGQSNMCGGGKISDLEAFGYVPPTNVKTWTMLDGSILAAASWRPVSIYSGRVYLGDNFGPEMGLAQILSNEYPHETLYFIKIAWGGTGLYSPNRDDKTTWLSENSITYDWFLSGVREAISKLSEMKIQYQLTGMFWMQGENDAGSFVTAQRYNVSLREFVTKIRSDLGVPNLPFVYGKIQNAPVPPQKSGPWPFGTTWPFGKEVQYRQFLAQNQINNARCVEATSKEEMRRTSDPAHNTSAGALAVGRDFGQAWIDYTHNRSRSCRNPKGID